MNRFQHKIALLILCIALPLLSFAQENEYVKKIEQERAEKDLHFEDTTGKSVLLWEQVLDFAGLNYFPVNEKYKVTATFKKKKGKPFEMKTSTDRLPVYRKYGELSFEIDGKAYTLTVYQNQKLVQNNEYKDYLFVPFTDNTCGTESYDGGRYIDIMMPKGKTVELDFNIAYNPYCAYRYGWSCPIPPPENYLKTRITAGEKAFRSHAEH